MRVDLLRRGNLRLRRKSPFRKGGQGDLDGIDGTDQTDNLDTRGLRPRHSQSQDVSVANRIRQKNFVDWKGFLSRMGGSLPENYGSSSISLLTRLYFVAK